MSEMIRVNNNTARMIQLPVIRGYRHSLIPGGNNVPADYLQAILELPEDSGGAKLFAGYQHEGYVSLDETPGATDQPEGPPPPRTLGQTDTDAALLLVAGQTDVEVLQRWATDRREKVKQAVRMRLAQLGSSFDDGFSGGGRPSARRKKD